MDAFTLFDSLTRPFARPIAMGILNVTEDSFFDGGKYTDEKSIRSRIQVMVQEGASILDFGACSTRPGAIEISEAIEIERLIKAIAILKSDFPDFPFSIDTYRSGVVHEVVKNFGPCWVNDISGGNFDSKLIDLLAKLQLPYVLMHIQGNPATMQQNPSYVNVIDEVVEYLRMKKNSLEKAGLKQIILDPGFGFGKTIGHNYSLLANLPVFRNLEAPLLVGLSRKSMIYKLLGTTPADALNATTALNMIALEKGAGILRVHDVREASECIALHQYLLTCTK